MHKLSPTAIQLRHLKNRLGYIDIPYLTASAQFFCHARSLSAKAKFDFVANNDEHEELEPMKPVGRDPQLAFGLKESSHQSGQLKRLSSLAAQISHPWPEWVDLMGALLKEGYFDGDGNPFENAELGAKEANRIRTACLNFARDRYDAMRYLSKKHIRVIVGCGCPTTDRKVVNSGKRLRAHAGVEEGDVCSSCNLRGNCERAFVKAREDEGGRTVDVMRILLTYGLDPIHGTMENTACLNKKVEESVRLLLKQIAEYGTDLLGSDLGKSLPTGDLSAQHSSSQEEGHRVLPTKQGDWHCPKCDFLNFARNIKCLRCESISQERLNQLKEDHDHLPLKKGDWICDNCNFFNFAKNTRCFLCKEKPPKRQLNPGEWICESCDYLNFRRNTVCLKCDYRRPKASCPANAAAHENGNIGNCQNNGNFDFWNSQRPRRINRMRVSNMWSFGDEDNKFSERSNSSENVSGIPDFPIVGGASDLSCDAEKREVWKLKMLERSKMRAEERADADEPQLSGISRKLKSPKFDDDDEMAGWFGSGKT